jgi:hypothetical protein
MKPAFVREVRDTPREALIGYHFGWGLGIRNELGLWGWNDALLASCAAASPGATPEPDPVSQVIITKVWEQLQREREPGARRGDAGVTP